MQDAPTARSADQRTGTGRASRAPDPAPEEAVEIDAPAAGARDDEPDERGATGDDPATRVAGGDGVAPGPPAEGVADDDDVDPSVLETLSRIWGYERLRPLQGRSIRCGLEHVDALTVLPTGGGKSLCYQLPAAMRDGTDLVVSPLVSLMQDQVAGLLASGVPAAALHSNQSPDERREVLRGLEAGRFRLLYVAPERLASTDFQFLLGRLDVRAINIDEAHCISHWGHDFRPEYRDLRHLRERFPDASMHAFTATATPRVREDVVRQLELRDPEVLVGDFDRPNLVFRFVPRTDGREQILEAIRRHDRQAVIVYCISRKDTEQLADRLRAEGIDAKAYHAGMSGRERTRVQDAFLNERLDVVVATVAFGMGIDRSDVRCVVHAAMPKSVEHYLQEAGRAGRDGLPAECVLLHADADRARWERLIRRTAEETGSFENLEPQRALLRSMLGIAGAVQCRHGALVRHFGQDWTKEGCGACDVCLGETKPMPGSTTVARKVLSAVARVDQRFGAGHVVDVLVGKTTDMVERCRHDELSVFGILRDTHQRAVRQVVHQLVALGLLEPTPGDRPILKLTEDGVEALRGARDVPLAHPARTKRVTRSAGTKTVEAKDESLFEALRAWRREEARTRGVPPYLIAGDRLLAGVAELRPATLEELRAVPGIGEKKLESFGEQILQVVADHGERSAGDVPDGDD